MVSSAKTSNTTSIDWLYDFTQEYYKGIVSSLAGMNQRLTALIGFSGVVLKFAADLVVTGTLVAILKLVVLVALTGCILNGAWGLIPKATGTVVPPGVLLDEWRYKPEEGAKLLVVVSWRKAAEELYDLRSKKAKFLGRGTTCLIAAVLLFAAVFALQTVASIDHLNSGCNFSGMN